MQNDTICSLNSWITFLKELNSNIIHMHLYQNETGVLFKVNTGVSLVAANSVSLLVKYPSGTEIEWLSEKSTVEDGIILYTTKPNDLSEIGTYFLQAKVLTDTATLYGDTAQFRVRKPYD